MDEARVIEEDNDLDEETRRGHLLVQLARHALGAALDPNKTAPLAADLGDEGWLDEPGAVFITLRGAGGRLRGCIGSVEAHRPLLEDLRANAVAAAVRDPRFPPVTPSELDEIRVEVSWLSAPVPMKARDEAHALRQLRPGVDGLILSWSGHRATFLPQVWEQLREPRDFLTHLKRKARLPADFWSGDVRLLRYGVRKWIEEEM